MRFSSMRYLIKQGWKNMGANRLMTFASIGVLTACFIITGFATLLLLDVNRVVQYMAGQHEIMVNLYTDTDEERALAIGDEIRAIPNVATVEYVSKDDAFKSVQQMLDTYGNLLEGYDNIFPARYYVTVEDLGFIEQTNTRITAISGVEMTYVSGDLADVMVTIQRGVTYGGYGIVALLGVVSVINILNTIRLTVFARRREISIMKYVGATNFFIRMPFFVEGMTVGIIAGLIATGVIVGGYYLIYDFLHSMHNVWVLGIMSSLYTVQEIWPYVLGAAVALGVFLGGLGTAFSVRKHLKV